MDLNSEMATHEVTPKHTAFKNDSTNGTYTQTSLTMSLKAIILQLPLHSCDNFTLSQPCACTYIWDLNHLLSHILLVTKQSMESLKTAFNLLLIHPEG